MPFSFEPLAIRLPHRLAELFGCSGPARFVAFYWEQVGDEVMFDDGQSAGTAEWYPFKRFVEHLRVVPHIATCDFGSSETEAQHWLIIDRSSSQAYTVPVSEARTFLCRQHPTLPTLTTEQLSSVGEKIRKLATQLPTDAQLRAIDAFAQKQHRQVERLVRFLDRLPVIISRPAAEPLQRRQP